MAKLKKKNRAEVAAPAQPGQAEPAQAGKRATNRATSYLTLLQLAVIHFSASERSLLLKQCHPVSMQVLRHSVWMQMEEQALALMRYSWITLPPYLLLERNLWAT